MKTILSILILGIALINTGCYSNTSKQDGAEAGGHPAPSRSDRY